MLKDKTTPFTVTYYSAAATRPESDIDILEKRWLHKIFLLAHIPASWSAWKLAAGLLIGTGLVGLIWLPFGPAAMMAAGIYLIFALVDWGLLWWLPRSSRSFGPIGPQLFVKTIPRLGAAMLPALILLTLELFCQFANLSSCRLGANFGLTTGLGIVLLLQLIGTLIYFWGSLREPFALAVSQMAIQTPGLPANAPPIRLLHLSDLHLERLTQRESRLLELIEEIRPDLMVITGDYLNLSYVNDPVARTAVRQVLAQLHAPYGVYATLGSPPVDPRDTTPSLFEGLPIRLLRDEAAVLTFADGRTLTLLGLDCEHDLAADAQVFQELLKLVPPSSTQILLYHSPELMPVVQQHPVDLYLCGHTHGGQVRLPFYGALLTSSALGKQYEMGAYTEQNTTLYISRGIGLEGLSAPRLRLLCPPEITLFTLSGPKR